jgi:heme-degrading monooxygenase HmoA
MAVLSYFPIQLPPEARAGFERAWKSRLGEVDKVPGFISTELVALANRDEYVVLTRFEDAAAFEAWMSSDAFTRGHGGESYAKYRAEDNPFLKNHKLYEVLGS